MEDVLTPQSSNCWRISTLWTDVCGWATSHNTPVHTLCHHSSALCVNSYTQPVSGHLTVMLLSWHCSRISPCENQQSVNITFPTEGCVLNFFLHWQCWMSPFHTLALPPWLFIMDLFLVPGQDAPQECLTFVAILIQMVWALCQQLHLSSTANCFGTFLAHTLFKVESVVNDFMGRAMTKVHVRDHFLNRHVIV